jgi:hypothetical protein
MLRLWLNWGVCVLLFRFLMRWSPLEMNDDASAFFALECDVHRQTGIHCIAMRDAVSVQFESFVYFEPFRNGGIQAYWTEAS